ncbi:hypothetical protein ABWK22_01705 [Gottfriedia acidiceleris]|uniref:hypothetical protein n=1 Tax=Gottfriedia acidiceleris TaxID=371036 RepID=UPI00339739E6
MVKFASILVVILVAVIIWYLLNPLFSKIGNFAIKLVENFKRNAAEEYKDEN